MIFLCELISYHSWLSHLQSYKELAESEKATECLQKAIDLDDKYDVFLGSKIIEECMLLHLSHCSLWIVDTPVFNSLQYIFEPTSPGYSACQFCWYSCLAVG